ncbi:MAG: tripartite tricarboxylate transporter substrate binding protein [Xanthobacteraceae bacterium]|nr:tripartite tricarboxylate transporter substrate binding protein [Xanthobacteraceae bacterium]
MNRVFRGILAGIVLLGATAGAQAQSWPDRPIKFISSQAAGGGTDVIGRLMGDRLAARVGQPVVFENRPGGGNVIGTQAAARSAPDGTTFFFASAAALVTDPYTFKSLPYDPMKDFTVISRIAQVSFMILAHPDVPAKNLPELIAYARANPDKVAVATDGARRFSGMIAAWLNKLAGTRMSYVPYTQMTQGLQDAIAGRVQLVIVAMPTAKPHIATGKLKALAVTSRERLPEFRDVPAVAETFPGFDFPGWWVLAAPTGVPNDIVARVNKEMSVILNDAEVVGRMNNMGFTSTRGGTLSEVNDYIQAQHKAWGTLVKEIGLQPE